MRARRSSSSDSGVSIVNGRIAVASADRSAISAMRVLLGDGGEVTARSLLVSSAHRPRREPWVLRTGLLTGLLAESPFRRRWERCEATRQPYEPRFEPHPARGLSP